MAGRKKEVEDRWEYKIKRMKKNIKLREIAKEIGLSVSYISQHENYKRNMDTQHVIQYKQFIDQY